LSNNLVFFRKFGKVSKKAVVFIGKARATAKGRRAIKNTTKKTAHLITRLAHLRTTSGHKGK
jgi:hypothetical protein